MLNKLKNAIREIIGVEATAEKKRSAVAVAKWKENAQSPVFLMIDDLTNAWVTDSKDVPLTAQGDWGGRHDRPDSIYSYLKKELFSFFPEIRAVFFTVVGKISQYNHHQAFSFSAPINNDKKAIDFFLKLFKNPRFEIAYHGYNHGTPGNNSEGFIQEWDGFPSVDAAVNQIKKGQRLYKDVFGCFPSGGKYGGWKYNRFAQESIDQCGFSWWCRDWMAIDAKGDILPEYYEPQYFGKNRVIALPSTVHGRYWSKRQINRLLKRKQIISIEEHMGALRPDGRIQTPNVYDDIKLLRKLFHYLRGKNVWHATATEISDYFDAYKNTFISDIGIDSFILDFSGKKEGTEITLLIQDIEKHLNSKKGLFLISPNGSKTKGKFCYEKKCFLFNVNVYSGKYLLKYH